MVPTQVGLHFGLHLNPTSQQRAVLVIRAAIVLTHTHTHTLQQQFLNCVPFSNFLKGIFTVNHLGNQKKKRKHVCVCVCVGGGKFNICGLDHFCSLHFWIESHILSHAYRAFAVQEFLNMCMELSLRGLGTLQHSSEWLPSSMFCWLTSAHSWPRYSQLLQLTKVYVFTQCSSWVRWLCICIYTLKVNDMLQSSRVKTSRAKMNILNPNESNSPKTNEYSNIL